MMTTKEIVDRVKLTYPGAWPAKYMWCGPNHKAAAEMESQLREANGHPKREGFTLLKPAPPQVEIERARNGMLSMGGFGPGAWDND